MPIEQETTRYQDDMHDQYRQTVAEVTNAIKAALNVVEIDKSSETWHPFTQQLTLLLLEADYRNVSNRTTLANEIASKLSKYEYEPATVQKIAAEALLALKMISRSSQPKRLDPTPGRGIKYLKRKGIK